MEYIVLYSKIVDNKSDGLSLYDIYYGGICENKSIADKLAEICVEESSSGIMIIPKIVKIQSKNNILKFIQKLTEKMYEESWKQIDDYTTLNESRKRI